MPIEFRCSQCNQLLRVPDESAGKNARCPKCQALMTVPDVQAEPATLAEGPPSQGEPPRLSDPLTSAPPGNVLQTSKPAANPFGDFGGSPFGGPATSTNPYAPPAPAAYSYQTQFGYPGARMGLPWETQPRTLGCWFRTAGMVLGSPSQAFSLMRPHGGVGTPLLFNFYAVAMIMALALVFVVPLVLLIKTAGGPNNLAATLGGASLLIVVFVLAVMVYAAIVAVVVPFILAAVWHVSLLLLGGAREGYETTFRVVCYGYFSMFLPMTLLGCIPYLGGLIGFVWLVAVLSTGLTQAHETSSGKAVAAILIPSVLCCVSIVALSMAIH